jgi:putative DNA primase/helicase
MTLGFRQAMESTGLMPRDIVADGRFYRCPTSDKPRKRNGAYILTIDGRRGYWRNYATETDWNSWADGRPVTLVDQARHEAQMRQLHAMEARRRHAAIRGAREYFGTLAPLHGGHPYIEAKGLSMQGCVGLRVDGDALVIPMFVQHSLVSLQTISPSGDKRYRTGCPVSAASFTFDRRAATVTAFAEGFATGLAVYQCVPYARVVVCFDAGNLVKVAKATKARGLAVVCADNDWRGSVNTGVEKGRQAAEAIGCGLAYPHGINGTDWADAMNEWGSPARVRMEVMKGATYVASG